MPIFLDLVYKGHQRWAIFLPFLFGGIFIPYVTVPKDVTKVKTKVVFNLTARQLVCFSAAAAIGIPLYFLTRNVLGNSMAVMLMIFSMMPTFVLAVYEKNGQPLEVIARNMIRVMFLRPKHRPYQTNNFYSLLERQDNLDKEVYRIVRRKTVHRRKESNQRSNRKGERDR